MRIVNAVVGCRLLCHISIEISSAVYIMDGTHILTRLQQKNTHTFYNQLLYVAFTALLAASADLSYCVVTHTYTYISQNR